MTRYLGDGWGIPFLDAANRRFFTAGQIVVQACSDCGLLQHPPEEVCRSCRATALGWRECRGTGVVSSRIVVHHAVTPALADVVPYAVVLVELDDAPGIRIVGNLLGVPPADVAIGQRVEVTFEEVADPESGETLRIPQWRLGPSPGRVKG